MGRLENRKRCLRCKYYGHNVCPLMANADVFKIDKCILDYDEIRYIKEETLEHFVFINNPIEYLSYLGYKDRENYPKPGQTVLALTGGFRCYESGKFLKIDSEDEVQLFLSDNAGRYCVAKDEWWKRLFKIE